MQFQDVMQQLEAAGSEQARKTYSRHGISGPMFGVSFAELKKLQKSIKKDQGLALELWQTGNHDARVLATMIADPKALNDEIVDTWMQTIGYPSLAAQLAGLVAKSPLARPKADAWIGSEQEYVSQAGWNILAELALKDKTLADQDFSPYLSRIEQDIHSRPNRTRYAMNGALIAIGVRSPGLEQLALKAAAAIGNVAVDHGDTSCETPQAVAYIARTLAKKGYVVKG